MAEAVLAIRPGSKGSFWQCLILGKPSTPLCSLADRHGRKAVLNMKLKTINMAPNLRIRGHLSAPIINGEEIEFENGPKWSNFRLSWADLDLDIGSGHGHYLFSSLLEYYLYTKFHRNRRNVFVDGRTYGNLPPIVFIYL